MTWDRRLYFPSKGRRAEDLFYALKNPTASVGFEPANLGTKGQHDTCRPPKPLSVMLVDAYVMVMAVKHTFYIEVKNNQLHATLK